MARSDYGLAHGCLGAGDMGRGQDGSRVGGSKGARDEGCPSAREGEHRYKIQTVSQSVSHGKERKARQPAPTSAWTTPRSKLTCTTYVCLVTPSALGVGLPLRSSQYSTCPPSWRPQTSIPPGNLLFFALLVPS
ncbi:hypothetical protein E2C01_047991 [Portunus trituberculatus]|uniref:Uncharacterized protein n=1 Tax=Portunus trituberculatus TaxID=210409 RepID=A0A5B7GC19_PORTR|nr:hypothetical protein [Portunus trituberculatus]